MKKILFSLMTMILVIGMVGAGSFAYFNDTETSEGNTFTAGTLDIQVDGKDDPDVWTYESPEAGLKPGASGEHTFAIKNVGSLPGLLTIKVGPYTEAAGDYPEPEAKLQPADIADLDDQLYIRLWDDDGTLLEGYVSVELSQGAATTILSNYVLASEGIENLGFFWEFQDEDPDINNLAQGDSVAFDIEFSIVQQ